MNNKAFTLIEILVVIALISFLSAIIGYSVSQYINSGKDSSMRANLAVLIPVGEIYYNNNNDSYAGFCSLGATTNTISQIPKNQNPINCQDSATAFAACGQEFSDNTKAYCVDSIGKKEDIKESACYANIVACP